jgi:Fe2+ or Zn2+ uptake regulation protein
MSKDFSAMLKEKGLKNTPTRRAILNVFSTDCKPINAEYIFDKLKKDDINLVTIYRTLESFEEVGILKRVSLNKASSYYELAENHHHHLICTNCGTIEGFKECDISDVSRKALKGSKFQTVSEHSLELFGKCKKCARL